MPDSTPSMRAVPAVPSINEVVVEDFDERRKQDELLIELDALNAAAAAAEHKENAVGARNLVRQALTARSKLEPIVVEERVITAAMTKIVGADPEPFFIHFPTNPDTNEWERWVTRTIIRAWLAWTQGQPNITLKETATVRERQDSQQQLNIKTGAVNCMALYIWAGAIEHLARGDNAEAIKFWKRAMGIASSYGADASLLIQWTYAASFFPVN
jgi:hypothetical protein